MGVYPYKGYAVCGVNAGKIEVKQMNITWIIAVCASLIILPMSIWGMADSAKEMKKLWPEVKREWREFFERNLT